MIESIGLSKNSFVVCVTFYALDCYQEGVDTGKFQIELISVRDRIENYLHNEGKGAIVEILTHRFGYGQFVFQKHEHSNMEAAVRAYFIIGSNGESHSPIFQESEPGSDKMNAEITRIIRIYLRDFCVKDVQFMYNSISFN